MATLLCGAGPATPTTTVKAVLGHEEVPAVTVTEAFKLYVEKIAREDTAGKSEAQYKLWYDSKKHAVDNFVASRRRQGDVRAHGG